MWGIIRRSVGDAFSILLRALVLFGRHWPTLTVIFLIGAICHDGILWFCVWLSEDHSTAAGFVLPFVPMATLTSLILMMRHLMPDLAHVRPVVAALETELSSEADPESDLEPVPVPSARPRVEPKPTWRSRLAGFRDPANARLTLLASALIPFLTVYVSQNWLREDARAFINAATFDEVFSTDIFYAGDEVNYGRVLIATGPLWVGIVLGAFLVRWGMGRFNLASKAVTFGLVAAYVEVLWVFLIAKSFDGYRQQVVDWIAGRQLVTWLNDLWQGVLSALGPVGDPVETAGGFVWDLLGQADDIIIIPIAWLTVGAVVYGRTLNARQRAESDRRAAWQARVNRVPTPVRRVGNEFTATVRDRFSSLGNGIRLLASAGLAPMLLFCVVFLLAAQVETGVQWLRRMLTGPMNAYDALTLTPLLNVFSRGAYLVVLVVLLAAAIDRILGHAEEDGLLAEASPEATAPTEDQRVSAG